MKTNEVCSGLLPCPWCGAVAFTLLTDRTREKIGGLSIGYADAEITGIVGYVSHEVGAKIQVVFPDKRWLESIEGCQGWALFIPSKDEDTDDNNSSDNTVPEGNYIVVECQGKVQGFWFKTLEDRAGFDDQDVMVEIVQAVGHAQDDFVPESSEVSQPIEQEPGTAQFIGITHPTSPSRTAWMLTHNNCNHGYTPNWTPLTFPATVGSTPITTCEFVPGLPGGDPVEPGQSTSTIKVRYLANTYLRMLSGAMGYAVLDNDIKNEQDNSTMRYYVVQSDQFSKRIKASL